MYIRDQKLKHCIAWALCSPKKFKSYFFLFLEINCIAWNAFIAKITLISKNISFEGIQNGSKSKLWYRIELRSVIKCLVVSKCKPREIYRICDV